MVARLNRDIYDMRSLPLVPAHDLRKCHECINSTEDALILDLEDTVPCELKPDARTNCQQLIAEYRHLKRIFVRINSFSTGLAEADLDAIVPTSLYGIVLPKCEGGQDVVRLTRKLAERETAMGLSSGFIRILPAVTGTMNSVFKLGTYTRHTSDRLCGLFWGEGDLAADIDTLCDQGRLAQYAFTFKMARSLVVLAAASLKVPVYDAVTFSVLSDTRMQSEPTNDVDNCLLSPL